MSKLIFFNFVALFISFSPLWQVRSETPKMPRTTSPSCTSSRPSIVTDGRRGRLCIHTSPVPQTPTTSAGSSAMSRTQCCSSLSGTMGSSELLFSGGNYWRKMLVLVSDWADHLYEQRTWKWPKWLFFYSL